MTDHDTAPERRPLADDPERQRIRRDLERTYFVEAGAGSGKSTAMVARVLSLIDAGNDITRIAAITFTEKAALELRVKIRGALDEAVRGDSAETSEARTLREHRRRQLEDLDSAPIGTIHAFCANILRRLPLEAGIPPTIDVEDPSMQAVSFRRMWRQQRAHLLREHSETAVTLMEAGMRPGRLEEIARAFHRAWDRADAWLADGGGLSTGDWRDAWHDLGHELESAAQMPLSGTSDGALRTQAQVNDYLELLRGSPNADAANAFRLVTQLRELKPGNSKVWGATMPESRAHVKSVNQAIAAARSDLIAALLAPLVREIATAMVHEAQQRTRTGQLQFHDLLVLTQRLLVGPHRERAHALLHEQYRWILVDEFQDTDPLQAEILFRMAAVSPDATTPWHELELRPGQLFMVGDPKQSIYRFRGADISTYLLVKEALLRQPPLPDGEAASQIESLVTNFRSDPDVLDWVNTAFGQLMPPPGTDDRARIQANYEPLDVHPRAPQPRATPAVHTDLPREDKRSLLRPLSEARQHELAKAQAAGNLPANGPAILQCPMHEQNHIAELLRHLTDPTCDPTAAVTIRDQIDEPARTVRPGDIAILLRSRGVLSDLEDALDAAGIEYRAEASNLIYATGEVRELRVILRAIANLADTGALALALRTSILGCGDDDLATWKTAGGTWNLHARVPVGLDEHPVARALAELRDLHQLARREQPAAILDHLVETHLLHTVTQDSPRHRDVTRRLVFIIDQARAWWEENHGSLRAYLDWVDLQDSDDGSGSEVVLDERDSSAVRILTMHSAKGLEFPVVVVMSGRQGRSDQPALIWDHSGRPHISAGSSLSTPGYEDAHSAEKEALDAERMRLMYVACTRAQHLLVLPRYRGKPSPNQAVGQFLGVVLEGRAASPTVDEQIAERYDATPAPATVIPGVPDWVEQIESNGADRADAQAPQMLPVREDAPAWFEDWAQLRERWQGRSRRPATVAVSTLVHTPEPAAPQTAPAPSTEPVAAPTPAPLGVAPETEEDDVAPVIGGAVFGTALHRILELTGLDPAADLAAITALVAGQQRRASGEILDEQRLIQMARATLGTAPLQEAARTGNYWFELDVVSALDNSSTDAALLVGRADFVYLDDGERLCVVDFKSDRAPSATMIDQYRQQVRTYLETMSRISGAPAGDGYLIFAAPEFEQVVLV